MALEDADAFIGGDVPDLYESFVGADGDEVSSLVPGDRSDRVVVARQIAQTRHLTRAGAPQIHAGTQAHAQHVLRRPVH